MGLTVVNLSQVAQQIREPYSLVGVAHFLDFAAYLCISQGAIAWHKHPDQDELFLVWRGELALESEWGNLVLGSGEMAVVPKGVFHRSASVSRSIVMIIERALHAERQNGQRRLLALRGERIVPKLNLAEMSARLGERAASTELLRVDGCSVRLHLFQGEGSWRELFKPRLLLVHRGRLRLEGEGEATTLEEGELVVVPRGRRHRMHPVERTVAVSWTQA